jgi:hypothetical protein
VSATTGLPSTVWAELQASGIAGDVAALNVAAFGPGTDRHWEDERAELVRFKRLAIHTESIAGNGSPQAQAGHLAQALINLDSRYRHLQAGGWRTLSEALPDLPVFDEWKPADPRQKSKRDPRNLDWVSQVDQHGNPVPNKYESPPRFPDGGGLLLPHVPGRCWELICQRHGLTLPDMEVRAAGFWLWALDTPALPMVITEGWKKALAAVSCGNTAVALPGAIMGLRVNTDGTERLIAAMQLLATPKRQWLIAFDADRKVTTAQRVGAAAGALARILRAADGRVEVASLPLLPGADKTGLDDLLVARGAEALDHYLHLTSGKGEWH